MGALNPFSYPKGGSDSGCLRLEGGARPRQLTGGQLAVFPLDPAMGFSLVGQGQGTQQRTVPANPTFPHSQGTLFPRRQGAEGAPISWQAGSGRSQTGRGRPEKGRPGVYPVLQPGRARAIISGRAQHTAACSTH